MNPSLASREIRGILLDIEGTTTPISFVHEVLFSYAREHVRDYLTTHFAEAEVKTDVAGLREEHAVDVEQELQPPPLTNETLDSAMDSLTKYIHWLIDRDRKSGPLKSLQGRIWKGGYLDGSLKAQVYADVTPALSRWQQAGLTINIFSSGSKLAQQLLFSHTELGDLTKFIDKYFDTTIGPKMDSGSYQRIAAALELAQREILFVSDSLAELDAARTAGMETRWCVRSDSGRPESAANHQIIRSFDELP